MIWMLIFCGHVQGGAVCLPPQPFRTAAACKAVGNALIAAHDEANRVAIYRSARCVAVPPLK